MGYLTGAINRNLEDVNSLPVPTIEISENPLNLDWAYDVLADSRSGGVALFVGRVREENEGKAVRGLTYTAHPTDKWKRRYARGDFGKHGLHRHMVKRLTCMGGLERRHHRQYS